MKLNTTLDYYNNNARSYFDSTINANMQDGYELFLKYLKGNKILDFGCGSGRDVKYFKSLGYDVDGIDGSQELCDLATNYTNVNIKCMDFNDFNEVDKYDGIWCSGTLLHVEKDNLKNILLKLKKSLTKNGIILVAMKEGNNEEIDSLGRYYNYITKDEFKLLVESIDLEILDLTITKSTSNINEEKLWLKFILRKKEI